MGSAPLVRIAMHRRVFYPGDPFKKIVFQLSHKRCLYIQIMIDHFRSKPHSRNAWYIFCSGPDVLLLLSPKHDGLDLYFAVNI